MIILSIVMGAAFLVVPLLLGIGLRQYPPKNINSEYGFRTGTTSKNQDTWDYSQKLAGNAMMVCSGIGMLVYALLLVINPGFLEIIPGRGGADLSRMYLGLALALIVFIVVIVFVQIKAKRFWENSIK